MGSDMGYDWPDWALDALKGIEPQEVIGALAARRRWPRQARSPEGVDVLAVWARTPSGRPLIVAVRQVAEWEWQIIGARDLRPGELAEFARWEASQGE
jgi:hypothetical protein